MGMSCAAADMSLPEAQVTALRDFVRRCGDAYRAQVEKAGGQMPVVLHCPQPANQDEDEALTLWLETVAQHTCLPVLRFGATRKYDA